VFYMYSVNSVFNRLTSLHDSTCYVYNKLSLNLIVDLFLFQFPTNLDN
jgi:hypothetical protein